MRKLGAVRQAPRVLSLSRGTKGIIAAAIASTAWAWGIAGQGDPKLDRYYNANALCKRGLFPLAIKEYEAFLAASPDHAKAPLARWGLAICYYSTGKMDKAQGLFARLAGNAQITDQAQLHTLWGSCLLELGKTAEASQAFEWTVKNAKKPARKADALAGLTQAQFLLKNFPAAVQASEELIRLAPKHAYADLVRYQGAAARLGLKKYAEAVTAFKGLIASGTDAKLLHQSVFQAAECLVKLEKLAEAISMYESAAMTRTGEHSELAHFNLGCLQFQTGRHADAINTLKRFARKYPDSALSDEASLLLGRAYLESKKHNEAIAVFEGILRGQKSAGGRRPRKPPPKPLAVSASSAGAQATLWLIRTYAHQRRYQTIRELLAPVVSTYRSDPASPELYYELATADMEVQQYASAAKNFAEAEKGNDPLPVESLRLRAYCLYRAGKCHQSLPLCDSFLTRHPESPAKAEVLFIKGENLVTSKRLAEAIPVFQAALKAGLDEAKTRQSHLRIAQAYYHQEMWAKCLASLQPLLPEDDAADSKGGADKPGQRKRKKPDKRSRKGPEAARDKLYDQVWFLAGDCHFRLKQWPKAVEALSRFLREQPDQPNVDRARYNLCLAYQKVGQRAEAIGALRPFLQAPPSQKADAESLRVRALLDLGRLQYEAEDYSPARETLRRIADHPDAIYYLGWIALKRNRPVEAIQYFGTMAKHPGHPFATDAALQRSVLQYRAGQYAEAEATLTALAGRFPRKSDNSDRIDALFYLGLCRARQKKFDKAIESFKEVARRAEKSPRGAEALYWQAWCQRQRGDIRQAETLYASFLSKSPAGKLTAAATFELAELRFHRNQQDDKLADRRRRKPQHDYAAIAALLEPLLAKDGKAPASGQLRTRVLYLLGWCLFKQGQMGPAAQAFETMIAAEEAAAKADRDYRMSKLVASACFQAGEARRRMKEFGPSKELFAKASRLRGQVSEADQDDVLLRLAQLQAINAQWRQSRRTAQDLLTQFPKSPLRYEAHFSVGWACENEKRYGEAMTNYRKVTAANVKDELSARAQFQIAECYFAQGQHDNAIAEFNLVIAKYGFARWSSLALLGMGRSFKAQGKAIQARAYFDDVILKYPKTTAAELAGNLLKTMQR